jgi:hypothetical protein
MLVRVEAPADVDDGPAPFTAVLRTDPEGRSTLTGADGDFLPHLARGQRVLLVRDDADDQAQQAEVVEAVAGGHDSVSVRVLPGAVRRRGRDGTRVPARVPAQVVLGTAAHEAGLLDVSAGGARVTHDGPVLTADTAVELRCRVPELDGSDHTLHITATVVWSGSDREGRAAAGLRFDQGQRLAVSRLVRGVRAQSGNGPPAA